MNGFTKRTDHLMIPTRPPNGTAERLVLNLVDHEIHCVYGQVLEILTHETDQTSDGMPIFAADQLPTLMLFAACTIEGAPTDFWGLVNHPVNGGYIRRDETTQHAYVCGHPEGDGWSAVYRLHPVTWADGRGPDDIWLGVWPD